MQSIARMILRRPLSEKAPEGLLEHYKSGIVDMRRFNAACVFLLAITLCYGAYLGDHIDQVKRSLNSGAAAVSGVFGLTIGSVTFVGQKLASEGELIAALGFQEGDSMLTFSARNARQRLENLGWVRKASVHRLFPNSVLIEIEERKPFAIWQRHKRWSVIDKQGITLGALKIENYGHLPYVVGFGAEKEAFELFELVDQYPALKSRVRAVFRVAERRWNLRLVNGITINLPELGVREALAQLAKLDGDHGLLSRDIELVDFRLADRVTIRLTDSAALRRAASFNENVKKSKRSGGRKT